MEKRVTHLSKANKGPLKPDEDLEVDRRGETLNFRVVQFLKGFTPGKRKGNGSEALERWERWSHTFLRQTKDL